MNMNSDGSHMPTASGSCRDYNFFSSPPSDFKSSRPFDSIPNEILYKIFSYLQPNPSDLLACSEVCNNWYALTSRFITDNFLITVDESLKSLFCNENSVFRNSPREYKYWHFKELNFDTRNTDFFNTFCSVAPNIKSLKLTEIIVNNGDLCEVIAPCTSLKSLDIQLTKIALVIYRPFYNAPQNTQMVKNLEGLESFSFGLATQASDAIFDDVMQYLPHLKHISFANNNISFHNSIFKRFYPDPVNDEPSEHVMTSFKVMKWIEILADSLESLDFSNTRIDKYAIKTLSGFQNLKLKSLNLSKCNHIDNCALFNISEETSSLKYSLEHIDLTSSGYIDSRGINVLTYRLGSLKSIKLRDCRHVAVDSLHYIWCHTFSDVEVSNTDSSSTCTQLLPYHYEQPLLKSLSLGNLSIDSHQLLTLGVLAPNITSLDLAASHFPLRDCTLMMMFTLVPNLQALSIAGCSLITDSAMMGIIQEEHEQSKEDNNCNSKCTGINLFNTDSERRLIVNGMKITWSDPSNDPKGFSRRLTCAHNDCKTFYDYGSWPSIKKRIVNAMIENEVLPAKYRDVINSLKPSSISSLKNMKKLNLSGLCRLTDDSLKMAFKFNNLTCLNLSECSMITHEGIHQLMINCPSIEQLDLSHCEKITDLTIEIIINHLPRLSALHVSHCLQLTSNSLESLSSCRRLLALSIVGCTKIGLKAIEELSLSQRRIKINSGNTTFVDDLNNLTDNLYNSKLFVVTLPPTPPPLPGFISRVRNRIFR